jgi:hypothetical protein
MRAQTMHSHHTPLACGNPTKSFRFASLTTTRSASSALPAAADAAVLDAAADVDVVTVCVLAVSLAFDVGASSMAARVASALSSDAAAACEKRGV